jgi:hypothetical protein
VAPDLTGSPNAPDHTQMNLIATLTTDTPTLLITLANIAMIALLVHLVLRRRIN